MQTIVKVNIECEYEVIC